MQTTAAGFTAEAQDSTRKPVLSSQISWKKDYLASVTFFTIGVSTIGGNDIIAGAAGVQSEWNNYKYIDESYYLLEASWERQLNIPLGGVSKALADLTLDNTTHRFTPQYMGGQSEINTAILPRRPVILNAGFNYNGIDQTVPQFVGLFRRSPKIDERRATAQLEASDFLDYLSNKKVDETTMFTGLRTDQALANVFSQLGYSTAQYEFDEGRNTIGFGIFDRGLNWLNYVNDMVQAENGHLYQDEEGRIRFENRLHWDNSPHSSVVRVINTSEVIEAYAPNEDHLVNMVEVRSSPRTKEPNQLVFQSSAVILVPSNGDYEYFVDFEDPMLAIDVPTYLANSTEDGTGTNLTANITIKSTSEFARAAKYVFHNSSSTPAYITSLTIYGRPAKVSTEIYERVQRDSSVTAYEERPLEINNDYIQDNDWARTFGETILYRYAEPDNLVNIVIRAQPELQFGDRISWQGHQYIIWGIKTQIDPQIGFIQEINLLKTTSTSYFTIGVSSIGGADVIAP